MRRCCIVLPTQSVWIAWLSQLACCFAKQAAFQTIDKVHRLFFFLEKLYPENKPNDIVPMSTTHPTPAPTQLFCETIKPSQDLHSLCLKLGYTLESLFSRRCCILRPRKPWNHPWQTWQRRSTLLLCATRTGFSLPGVMKGSKTAQQTVNSLHQAVQHGKRIMRIAGPAEIHRDIHHKRHCQTIGLASALMSSGHGRGSYNENALKICQQFQHSLTHTPGIRTKEQHHRKQQPQGASNHLRIKDRLGFQAQAILVVLL